MLEAQAGLFRGLLFFLVRQDAATASQVFRFPGGGNKNAVDMRLAMDATALLGSGIETFVLVILAGSIGLALGSLTARYLEGILSEVEAPL